MKWMLVIWLTYHSAVIVPVPFSSLETCKAAGDAWQADVQANRSATPRFHCMKVE